jgi:hypothetical protein
MARAERSVLREGIVAGLIGAAVVAVWFLVFDLALGRPLHTPTLLGAVVFSGLTDPTGLTVSFGLVLGYSLVHGLAFMAFGVIAATIIAVAEREPPLFIGFIILFACFEVFVLAVIGAFGQSMQEALEWWAVLIGNLLATVAMLWYFFRAHAALPRALVGSWGAVLREGIVAGLIGAALVAIWFFVVDAAQGEPLRTPRLLGQVFLRQTVPMAAVSLYTLAHGLAFVGFGIVGALLVAGAERQPMLVFALVILFTAFEIFFFGLVVIAGRSVLDELAAWTIFVGNVLAAAGMLAYYFKGHRDLARRVTSTWAEED